MFGFKRNKSKNWEAVLSEKLNYLSIFEKLIQYLNISGNDAQAGVVKKLTELMERDNKEQFIKLLNSASMWGGSGAVWEVYINDKVIEKEFQKEIVHLIDLMERTRILGKGIKPIRKAFTSTAAL